KDEPDEDAVADQIAAREPARILQEAVDPLEAEPLEEHRRAAALAGEDVEGAADPHHERRADSVAVPREERLLHGRLQSDEEQIWLSVADLLDDCGFLVFAEVAVPVAHEPDAG